MSAGHDVAFPPPQCESTMNVDDSDVLRAVMAFLDDQDNENEHNIDDDGSATTVPVARETERELLAPLTPLNSDAGSGSPSPSPSDTESTATSASNTGTSTKTYPRVVNHSRLRRRHEVLSLREQVVALQERLRVIHQRNARQDDEDGEISTTQTDPSDSALRVAAWQAVAECQRDQLQDAEQERDKLRALVREYKLSIRRVDRFLKKHTPVHPTTFTRAEQLLAHNVVDLESTTSDGFEEISCNLPTMYLQINGVFKDARLDSLVDGLRDIQVQNETTPHMSIETLESRVLPFDVASTAKAVWKFHQVKAQTVIPAVNEQLEQSEDTLRRTFLATLELPNYKGRARGRMETRRFVERDRVVIVQCAIFDRTERLAGKYVEGFGIRQFHWTVIGPPRNEKLRQCGRPVSQIETFEVGLPFRESSSRKSVDPKRDQEEMKQFCLEAAEVVLEMESQAVENILLNLSLGLFDDLQRGIASMYKHRDTVFRDSRFNDVLSSMRMARVVNEHTPRVSVELLDAQVVPFGVQETATAVWDSMVHRIVNMATYDYEASEFQNNRIQKSFVLDLPHLQLSVRGKVVVHRIIEPSRVVILRATQVTRIGLSNSDTEPPTPTVHFQWTSIEAPHHERLRNSNRALAQIQSFDLSFPRAAATNGGGSSPSSVLLSSTQEEDMIHFCKTAVAHHLDHSRQTVEHMLVSRSWKTF